MSPQQQAHSTRCCSIRDLHKSTTINGTGQNLAERKKLPFSNDELTYSMGGDVEVSMAAEVEAVSFLAVRIEINLIG